MKTGVALLLLLAPFVTGKVFTLNGCLVTSEGGEGDITEDLKNCTAKMAGKGRFYFHLNSCYTAQPFSGEDVVPGICPKAMKTRAANNDSASHHCNGDAIKDAAEGNLEALRRRKSEGCNMAAVDYDNRTALHLAAAQGNADCVTFLLYTCLVPFQPLDRWQHTPLSEARRHHHTGVANTIAEWIGPFAEATFVADTDTDKYEGLIVKEDCRVLCQLASGCKFFNFIMKSSDQQSACWLKTELGEKTNGTGSYFGHKNYIGEVLADSSVIRVHLTTLIIGSSGAGIMAILILLVCMVIARRFRTEDVYEDVQGALPENQRPPTSSVDSGGNIYKTMSAIKWAGGARFVPLPGQLDGATGKEEEAQDREGEPQGSRLSSNVYFVPGEEGADYV